MFPGPGSSPGALGSTLRIAAIGDAPVQIVMPPSTQNAWPVANFDSSLAR
jgi:hypothetical protein